MLCLAIDTAGPVCAAAIARQTGDGHDLLAHRAERIERGHAERLMPMIGEVLGSAGLEYADLDRIAVAAGPGSFTGVRIGVAAARGLALALAVPAFGVDVLAAIAASVPRAGAGGETPEILVAALDARRDAVYLKAEEPGGRIAVASAVVARHDIRQALQAVAGRRVAVVGSGAAMVAEAIAATRLGDADHADIAVIARLGLAGAGVSPPVPLYLRAPDARPQAKPALVRA